MGYVLVILGAYLLGCSNMAMYLAKLKKVDLSGGSGNPGTSNATLLMGWRAGVIVGIHDIGKGLLAVWFARWLFPSLEYGDVVAGVACVLGHMFPVFMGFKGGKGFASYLGMTLALHWQFALIIMAVLVVVTVVTDYIVLGTVVTVVTTPVVLGFLTHSLILVAILCVATAVILFKHRENYVRIWKGTEIGLSHALKKDHKVK